MTAPRWAPLLSGDDARQAADALAALTADLVSAAAPVGTGRGIDSWSGPGLSCGRTGTAVFLATNGHARQRADEIDLAVTLLDASIRSSVAGDSGLSFSDGITGIAWAVAHLGRWIDDALVDDDPMADVDRALATILDDPAGVFSPELLYGVAGYALCALQRPPGPAAPLLLTRIAALLAELSHSVDAGITWRTPPAHLDPDTRRLHRYGRTDLGVAHGAAGIISVLARMATAGIALADSLLAPAIDALLDTVTDGHGRTTIPPFAGYDLSAGLARTAWCYGDLGVAAALLAAARFRGREDWEARALSLAHAAATRSDADMNLVSTGLCHGTAGAAHLFNRMYQATGDEVLRHAAVHWFRVLLDQRRVGRGIGGYGSLRGRGAGVDGWWGDPGLLDGAAGVGLALLSATHVAEPHWDELLAVSIP